MQEERQKMRQCFVDAWHKREQKEHVTALEQQLIDTICQHPEYRQIVENPASIDKDYATDNNPFLHMSMHVGLIEQLTTNRPAGIRGIYQKLFEQYGDEHQIQHLIMEIMAEIIWDAQQSQQLPNESLYLEKLHKLSHIDSLR